MSDDTQQPAPKKPMTPAERQRASRAARKKERFNTCPAKQISIMLSAEASQALEQLVFNSDLSQKTLIEKLLIDAYKGGVGVLSAKEAPYDSYNSWKSIPPPPTGMPAEIRKASGDLSQLLVAKAVPDDTPKPARKKPRTSSAHPMPWDKYL